MPSQNPADVKVVGVELYLLPIKTRVPLKFGGETLSSVTCARAVVTVADRQGNRATGWGETPLSVQWVWPSKQDYGRRSSQVQQFACQVAEQWFHFGQWGHPLEIGHRFQQAVLQPEISKLSQLSSDGEESLPLLAGLLCCAPFDLATYDAYGNLHGQSVWKLLGKDHFSTDLQHYFADDQSDASGFANQYVADYLKVPASTRLDAWHLVGGLDPLHADDLAGDEPEDGYPLLLGDWIQRDGLRCLKVKLRGNDLAWDYQRLVDVARVGQGGGVEHLSADFNCMVTDPAYVVEVLDRLQREQPRIYEQLLYVEQPFPYDLQQYPLDVRDVSRRKLLLMDESAHHWQLVRWGQSLGWTGVALKTCKTLTGALLSMCWAQSQGMSLMVQDLTNPMLAQLSHLQLAAHCSTLRGVETNSMQFYPQASTMEARVHPGAYRRKQGQVDLSTLAGAGFGYRVNEMQRHLPDPVVAFG